MEITTHITRAEIEVTISVRILFNIGEDEDTCECPDGVGIVERDIDCDGDDYKPEGIVPIMFRAGDRLKLTEKEEQRIGEDFLTELASDELVA